MFELFILWRKHENFKDATFESKNYDESHTSVVSMKADILNMHMYMYIHVHLYDWNRGRRGLRLDWLLQRKLSNETSLNSGQTCSIIKRTVPLKNHHFYVDILEMEAKSSIFACFCYFFVLFCVAFFFVKIRFFRIDLYLNAFII